MTVQILLTSFDIWLSHHQSNSSDDLLGHICDIYSLPYSITFQRKLPVDFQLAPSQVIAKINSLNPTIIICCGMAESRQKLTVESRAFYGESMLKTTVNLKELVKNLAVTEISNEAGKFVCEALYYSVLKHCLENGLKTQVIFVHVPILTPDNQENIINDFLLIIRRLSSNL